MRNQFANGDRVNLICGGETIDGEVSLASQNGKWLIVRFDAVVNGHIGVMPLERKADDSYRSLANGATVKLSPKAPPGQISNGAADAPPCERPPQGRPVE